jgi:hypothetical protein
MQTPSIYRDLRPTLILLFCLGFDIFPKSANRSLLKFIRRIINILQYMFLSCIWLNSLLYRLYNAWLMMIALTSLVEGGKIFSFCENYIKINTFLAQLMIYFSYTAFDLVVIVLMLRLCRSGTSFQVFFCHFLF